MKESTCIGCGCTDNNACENGCFWKTTDRKAGIGVCSECSSHMKRWRAGDRSMSARALLPEAMSIIAEEREEEFAANQIDGKVYDARAKAELRRLDAWLRKAKKVTV